MHSVWQLPAGVPDGGDYLAKDGVGYLPDIDLRRSQREFFENGRYHRKFRQALDLILVEPWHVLVIQLLGMFLCALLW